MDILVLSSTSKSIRAVLEETENSNPLHYTAHYADKLASDFTPGDNQEFSNDTTPVEIVSAPGASTQREIRNLTIFNDDDIEHNIRLSIYDTSDDYYFVRVTLAAGGWFAFGENESSGGSGTGVTDGDKGDITVSGSGATWTIDDDAVTYAKMQNVSATSRVLGRKAAGAGNIEELTLSELLDFIGSAAQGDILYRGASAWARLGAGTNGQYLKTQGASANPAWATFDGWIPISATLTYSSADDPIYVVSSNADLTSVLSVGMKIKFTNNSTTFYGIIHAIGSWSGSAQLITIHGGTDYDVANSAITSPYYSPVKSPQGFPMSKLKWRVTLTDTENKQKASPTLNTWYGGANAWSTGSNMTLDAPIGEWDIGGSFYQYVLDTSATIVTMEVTISTSDNSESDEELTAGIGGNGASSTMTVRQTSRVQKTKAFTVKTTLYILARSETTGMAELNIIGATRATVVTLDDVYL